MGCGELGGVAPSSLRVQTAERLANGTIVRYRHGMKKQNAGDAADGIRLHPRSARIATYGAAMLILFIGIIFMRAAFLPRGSAMLAGVPETAGVRDPDLASFTYFSLVIAGCLAIAASGTLSPKLMMRIAGWTPLGVTAVAVFVSKGLYPTLLFPTGLWAIASLMIGKTSPAAPVKN